MKKLKLKKLENVKGGSCFFAIPIWILSGAPHMLPQHRTVASIFVDYCWNS